MLLEGFFFRKSLYYKNWWFKPVSKSFSKFAKEPQIFKGK